VAKLDDLIAHIRDPRLRAELSKAARELRKRTRFGLVFEDHIPEVTLLNDFPIRPGMTVFRRADTRTKEALRVIEVNGPKVKVHADGEKKTRDYVAHDLLVLKRFGDPIYPRLVRCGSVERGGGKPYHTVINGENYHALQLLTFMYEGQVDCMYLDPPYNTGARDWKYNNDYVDSNDAWRHSKWLSMMEKRLRLAKRLLKPDGVVVIMIDEHELHHLGVLLEQIFPEYLCYMVSIVINSRGSTGNRNFGVVEEQALFLVPDLGCDLIESRETYVPDLVGRIEENRAEELLRHVVERIPDLKSRLSEDGELLDERDQALLEQLAEEEQDSPDHTEDNRVSGEYWRGAVRTGQGTSYRTQRRNQFYPLYIDDETKEILRVGEPLLEKDERGSLVPPSWDPVDGLIPIWPTDEEGRERVWCYESGRMRREIEVGNIKVGRFNPLRNTYAVNVRRVRRTEQRFREITVWWDPSYDAGSNGTNILRNILGRSGAFPFPKSVYAVRDVLATIVGDRPDALIIDFFAGSGTTFHATALLNAQDGGERRTIMVTNNEVDPDKASELNAAGLFPGDAEFDRHGIFEAVTVPRVRAVIEGKRPDGSTIPGRHKWAGRRPFAEGFEENCAFFRLDYLDPDEVELGRQFEAILPILWLAAGGIGDVPEAKITDGFLLPPDSPFGVLLRETSFVKFAAALDKRPDVTHVWLVTDSERAFTDMRAALPREYQTAMLYRDYVRNFRINTRVRR
jgi:adenine-specific DNA-methyltransferase